tara:strand:- start:4312 stop:4593 length:282 start_codon:yes stop_codon:yes gene_type:complete
LQAENARLQFFLAVLLFCSYGHAMQTYLEQLDSRCARLGVDLRDICRAEGIAATTLARWRKGQAHPRQETAEALFARLDKMAAPPATDMQEAI